MSHRDPASVCLPTCLSLSLSLSRSLSLPFCSMKICLYLFISPSCCPSVHLSIYLSIYLCEHSVGLDRTDGPGLRAPTPHSSSMSSMPAMLRCVSTFVPRPVKSISTSLLGPVWDIVLHFDYIRCYDLSVI